MPVGWIGYYRDRGKCGAENCGHWPVEDQKCRFKFGQWSGSVLEQWQWCCMNDGCENYQEHDKSKDVINTPCELCHGRQDDGRYFP